MIESTRLQDGSTINRWECDGRNCTAVRYFRVFGGAPFSTDGWITQPVDGPAETVVCPECVQRELAAEFGAIVRVVKYGRPGLHL